MSFWSPKVVLWDTLHGALQRGVAAPLDELVHEERELLREPTVLSEERGHVDTPRWSQSGRRRHPEA